MPLQKTWINQGIIRTMAEVEAERQRNEQKNTFNTNQRRPPGTFYIFLFLCEAGFLLIILKLDNIETEFEQTHTHTHTQGVILILKLDHLYPILYIRGDIGRITSNQKYGTMNASLLWNHLHLNVNYAQCCEYY